MSDEIKQDDILTLPIAEGGMPQEFIDASEGYVSLGPNYFAGRKIAEEFMAKFEAEHFKPLIDKFTEQFREAMWEQVQDALMSDTENNIQHAIWHQVDRSVNDLLSGVKWAQDKYILGTRYDCDKIRAAIAAHIPKEIQDQRIVDLETELAEVKKSLEFARNRY